MLAQQIEKVLTSPSPESIPEQFTKEHLASSTINVYELALNRAS